MDNKSSESCKCKDPQGRNLVVCIDGTSNQFGKKNTNVVELYSRLDKNKDQLTYYNSGVGTYARSSWRSFGQFLDNKIDLAIAWNFEKIVMGAYRWLTENYEDGDRIFFFGFSRGAYQVRTIAGMIDKVGLIHKGNGEQIPFAYELYVDHTSDGQTSTKSISQYLHKIFPVKSGSQSEEPVDMAKRFKETFSRKDVKVHFIGAWDTVSSVGLIRDKNLPGTTSPDIACFFRHALALDERRVKFLPEYACGGVMERKGQKDQSVQIDAEHHPATSKLEEHGEPQDTSGKAPAEQRRPTDTKVEGFDKSRVANEQEMPKKSSPPHVKEFWFPGTHSDIGGGNVINKTMDRRHPSFLWMSYEAVSAGLKMNFVGSMEWKWAELGEIHESLTWVWKPLEYLPVKRLSYKDAEGHTWRLHRGKGRTIQEGQRLHASVAFCRKDNYFTKAPFPERQTERTWDKLLRTDLLELDIFDNSTADKIIEGILAASKSERPTMEVHRLTVMTGSYQGCQTLSKVDQAAERLIGAIQELHKDVQVPVANAVIDFIAYSDKSPKLLSDLLQILESSDELFKSFIRDSKASREKLLTMKKWVDANPELRKKILDCADHRLKLLDHPNEEVRAAAIDLMAELAKKDPSHRFHNYGIVKILFDKLRDRSWAVRWTTLDSMTKLAKYYDLYLRMLDFNIVVALLSKFEDEDEDENVCGSAIKCITILAKHEDSHQRMLDSGVVGILLDKLGHERWTVCQSALNSMTNLAEHYDLYQRMLDSNIIVTLLSKLEDEDEDVCESAIKCITEVAKHGNSHQRMLDSGIVEILLDKLQDERWRVHQSALNLMTNLTEHYDLLLEMKI